MEYLIIINERLRKVKDRRNLYLLLRYHKNVWRKTNNPNLVFINICDMWKFGWDERKHKALKALLNQIVGLIFLIRFL